MSILSAARCLIHVLFFLHVCCVRFLQALRASFLTLWVSSQRTETFEDNVVALFGCMLCMLGLVCLLSTLEFPGIPGKHHH
jgi:hypothetical protein